MVGIIVVVASATAAIATHSPFFGWRGPSVAVSEKDRLTNAMLRARAKSDAERAKARARARAAVREAARKRKAAAAQAVIPAEATTPELVAPATDIIASPQKQATVVTSRNPRPTPNKTIATGPLPAAATLSTVVVSATPVAPTVTERVTEASGFASDRIPAPTAPRAAASARKGIPPGFEEWFAPQKTAVDLYYGGRFLTTTLVEYTLDAITFLNPPEVAAKIPGLRASSDFGVLLADALPTHADQVCVRPNQPLCGRLEPATVGVIFDESRFRVDLFVHPSLLLEAQQLSNQYLPDPVHDRATLVQNLGALYSGSSEGGDRFSLFGRTRLGHGRGHGFANWVSTDENALSVDELGYTHDLKDIQISAGLFEPTIDALRAVPRQPIMGVSVARSLLTRTDLDSMIASPIELFIPVRGRVDIFRDDRLISTGFYEAGNQRIDTSRLPGGAYTIDIVITDVTGTTRTVQQLFIKSSLMAPPGEPLWFVDAGQVMQRAPQESFPNDFGTTQLRAGYRWRQKPWMGFGTAAALTENESLIELSTGMLFDWLEGGAELYGSSAGGSGFGLRGLTHWKALVASANFQKTTANNPAGASGQYQLLPNAQSLGSLYLSHPLWQGLLSASIIQRDDVAGSTSQRTTLGYSRTFPLGGHHSLQVQTEVGDEDGNALAMLSLQWRNIRGKWSDSAQVRISQSDLATNADDLSVGAATTWRDGDRFINDVEFSLRAEAGNQIQSVTMEGQHHSQYGRGNASLTTSDSNGIGHSLASLGYDTSIVVGEGGKTAFGGGPNLNEAGILMDLRSAPDARLEVSADGQPQFIAIGGSNSALTLAPYNQYRIRLRDRGLALTQIDEQPRDVTLYPGHVVSLDWKIQSVQVLLGRVITVDGQPLAKARIEGAEGTAFTDEEGFIQTEVRSDVRELVATLNGHTCRIILPAPAAKSSILRAPSLRCITATDPSPARSN